MSAELMQRQEPVDTNILLSVLAKGDLKELTSEQRLDYLTGVCRSLGLNPLTRPFEFISLSGKLTMYARKDATDQLRKIHHITIPSDQVVKEVIEGVYVVTVTAYRQDGTSDTDCGAVSIKGLQGEALANAYMKCLTKAKRRVTLSICGLGVLDETEIETIQPEPGVRRAVQYQPRQIGTSAVEAEILANEPAAEKATIDQRRAINTRLRAIFGDNDAMLPIHFKAHSGAESKETITKEQADIYLERLAHEVELYEYFRQAYGDNWNAAMRQEITNVEAQSLDDLTTAELSDMLESLQSTNESVPDANDIPPALQEPERSEQLQALLQTIAWAKDNGITDTTIAELCEIHGCSRNPLKLTDEQAKEVLAVIKARTEQRIAASNAPPLPPRTKGRKAGDMNIPAAILPGVEAGK